MQQEASKIAEWSLQTAYYNRFFGEHKPSIALLITCLKSSALDAPFGRVRTLSYQNQNHRYSSGQDNAVVP
jgi:hypothetical protein